MCVGHFNDYISSFLTRRHDPRGQFEDTGKVEIDLWEHVDEREDVEGVEVSDGNIKRETIDIKENFTISDETQETECRDVCAQHNQSEHLGLGTVMTSNIIKVPGQTQVEDISVTDNVSTSNEIQVTENGMFEEIDILEHVQSYSGKMYSCDQYDFSTSTIITLYLHKRKQYEDSRYICDQCDYTTNHMYYLNQCKQIKH